MKITVYKNRLTSHWMCDRAGTAKSPGGSHDKEGFIRWENALAEAIRIADKRRTMVERVGWYSEQES